MKSCFVAIIGRPSAGKSTLLNALCGEKVSITSPTPQTTKNKIRGILNTDSGQLVFIDTPGYHHSDKKVNLLLTDLVHSSLQDAELALYVVDATRPAGKEEEEIMQIIASSKKPCVAVINKIDLPDNKKADAALIIQEKVAPTSILEVSALQEQGLEELKKALFDLAPEGEPLYPEDYYTDQQPSFRIAEIIREKAINKVKEELPHSLYVEIADMEMKETKKGPLMWVRAFLTVEKESQKGMLIGKHATMIKAIRVEAQKELNGIFPYLIDLDLMVKVNHKWRTKDNLIRNLYS